MLDVAPPCIVFGIHLRYKHHKSEWLMHRLVLQLVGVAAFAHESKPDPHCHKSIMPMYRLHIESGQHITQLTYSSGCLSRNCAAVICGLSSFYTLNPRLYLL